MNRAGWLLAATAALALAAWLSSARTVPAMPPPAAAGPVRAQEIAAPPPAQETPDVEQFAVQSAAPQPLTERQVAQLLVDAQSADGGTRAQALDDLAAAPEAQALPVLQKAINGGEPIDRQLALNSLRTLALRQGDGEGWIRDLLRQVIYDGGDEAVASGAQAALDDIEYQAQPAPVDAAR